jgi:hypothetical protein
MANFTPVDLPQGSMQADPTQFSTGGTAETSSTTETLPAGAGITDLPKPLLDAILTAIAQQICSQSQHSTDRIKTLLRESEQR